MAVKKELRSEIREELDNPKKENLGRHYGKRPLLKQELKEIADRVGAEVTGGDQTSRYRWNILRTLGVEIDPFEANSPFTMEEIEIIHDFICADNGWEMIGHDSSGRDSLRELDEPDPTTRRFQVMAALAVNGPGTAREISLNSELPLSTINSEMTRLVRGYMAGRTKKESFEDVNKYWIRPEGLNAVRAQNIPVENEQKHREMNDLYGETVGSQV